MNLAIPTLQEPVVYGRFRYIDIWRKSHVSLAAAINANQSFGASASRDCRPEDYSPGYCSGNWNSALASHLRYIQSRKRL